jgi:hypothetical protein
VSRPASRPVNAAGTAAVAAPRPGGAGALPQYSLGKHGALKARGHRDQVVIATKVSQHPQFRGLAPETVTAACEASLRRLQADHIDLDFAHHDDKATPRSFRRSPPPSR